MIANGKSSGQVFEAMLKRGAPEIEGTVKATSNTAEKQPLYPFNEMPL